MKCDIRIKSPTYPLKSDLVIAHDADDTVLALKGKIQEALVNDALVGSAQKLIYGGHVLEDNKTLKQLNVPNSATFHLVTPPHVLPANDDNAHQEEVARPDPTATEPRLPSAAASTSTQHAASESAPAPTQEAQDQTIAAEAVPNNEQPQPSVTAFSAEAHAFLRQHERVEHTGMSYDLCYIDGFPYLVKAATARSTRHSRRSQRQAMPINTSREPLSGLVSPANIAPNGSIVRQHHVDLPVTAAVPVRTAEGRRALILSPEGVRAMAAQGINVDTNAAARTGPMGFNYVSFRRFMTTGIPHGWLVFKLIFLVTMLGSNATWTRFLLLNAIAFGIFLWQSGFLGRAFLGRPLVNNTLNAPHPAPVPSDAVNAHQDLSASRVGDRLTTAPPPTLLQSFTNAFLGSILPGTSSRSDAPANAAQQPLIENNPAQPAGNEALPTPQPTAQDQGAASASASQAIENTTEHNQPGGTRPAEENIALQGDW